MTSNHDLYYVCSAGGFARWNAQESIGPSERLVVLAAEYERMEGEVERLRKLLSVNDTTVSYKCAECGSFHLRLVEAAADRQPDETSGPGTPICRLTWLLDELEKRFPNSHDRCMSDPSEPKYMAAIDALLARSPVEPEVLPKCAKPDVHHPACNCLERERLAVKASGEQS